MIEPPTFNAQKQPEGRCSAAALQKGKIHLAFGIILLYNGVKQLYAANLKNGRRMI